MATKFGYTLDVRVESRVQSGARADYTVGVGIIENFSNNGTVSEYLNLRGVMRFTSFAYPDYDKWRTWGINPFVLPSYFHGVGVQEMSEMMLSKQWGGALEPELTVNSLSMYGGSVEVLKFLGKVFEYGRGNSLSKLVLGMNKEDADRWYSWDTFTRTMFYLHSCGARAYKRNESGDWLPMIRTCQWDYDNVYVWVDSTYLALGEMQKQLQEPKQLALAVA